MVKTWEQVVELDFPEVTAVTRKMVEAASRQTHILRGSVRLMTGRFSTSEELEERRQRALRPLAQ